MTIEQQTYLERLRDECNFTVNEIYIAFVSRYESEYETELHEALMDFLDTCD